MIHFLAYHACVRMKILFFPIQECVTKLCLALDLILNDKNEQIRKQIKKKPERLIDRHLITELNI